MGAAANAKPAAAEPGGFKALSATVKTITPDLSAAVKNRMGLSLTDVEIPAGDGTAAHLWQLRNRYRLSLGDFCARKGYEPYQTEQIG